MGFDMQKMMKQAQKMQDKMNEVQAELGGLTVTGSAGGGAVTITANGRGEPQAVTISKEAAEDIETLQDLVLAALKDTQQKASQIAQDKMAGVTQGLKMPGMM